MQVLIILSILCLLLSFTIFMTMRAFVDNDTIIVKIVAIITNLLVISLIIFAIIGFREEIKINTLNDYFEDKVEVIEHIDTLRTYKFN